MELFCYRRIGKFIFNILNEDDKGGIKDNEIGPEKFFYFSF